jgi:predicted TIM-barrel fold metal-dependent hydrolase
MPSFPLLPEHFGLPPRKQLEEYEIWDSYLTPASSDPDGTRLIADIERTLPTLEKGAIRRFCVFLHVGLGTADDATEARVRAHPDDILKPLRRWPERLLGMIRLNANDVRGSLDAINRWLRDGPMVGVYFPGGRRGSLPCNHPSFNPLVERIAEVGGLIMQHTWFKTGGKGSPGESTPAELAELAARFPEVQFLCAHAGGEWEKGIRAVRGSSNVLVETSGFDPTAGFIEIAVRELGAERIVFGSHLPSRSLGTEFGKIFGARIDESQRQLILGRNLRRLLAPILQKKS